ncbi:WD40 repeat domain-containing protein [Actinomadura rupiterrae]|uniref:WD40 repeat domain-containing protein n=1 Tax=Actinomadura rupiterrae TaxID=559627 RepID=UPI0020A35366|nr:WD40 repeat domain-containing protein [Actinomadura rupiterrae]MCP2342507.1 hypothetical protein [Actinomadura rupiterrae]
MEIIGTSEQAVLDALDSPEFDPARDLPALRDALRELERVHGVGEAHRRAVELVSARGAVLRHPDVHRSGISAQALSPSGRYLAVGDFGGDDYEAGATLQIWEVATGRCVNVIDGIVGGIGWPGYGGTLQWSADETRLAVEYAASNIGIWDPFGEDTEPAASVRLTYNGRPDPFALAPDGLRAYVMDEDSETFASIVEFASEETATIPAIDEDRDEDDEGFALETPFWSRDGARLHGSLHNGTICSIDIASGRLLWSVEGTGQHAVWSPDETVLAYRRGDELVIADAATGADIGALPWSVEDRYRTVQLAWGTRLAVVVPDEHGRVAIVDRAGRHLYDIDVAVRAPEYDLVLGAWAWAPDGDRAACLTTDGRVEIWSTDDRNAERLRAFDAPKEATGLLWGADDVLVALGPTVLRFLRADTGETISDVTLLRQPDALRPMELDDEDLGEELWPTPNPTFALDERNWALAFLEGVVIAPPGREADLAATLAWAVDGRHAWPVHWGELETYPDAPTAADQAAEPVRGYLEPFQGLPAPGPEADAWPPSVPATLDDLFDAFLDAVKELGEDGSPWSGEALREAALLRARLARPDGVRVLVEASPEGRRPFVAAEAAMLLATAGKSDEARTLLHDHAEACERQWNEPVWYATEWGAQIHAASATAGAHAALGDQESADRWFERARDLMRQYGDDWSFRLPIVRALLEGGREDQALALLDEGTGDPRHTAGVPFLAYALRTNRFDLAERVLRDAKDWFATWTVVGLLRHHGRTALLHDWADRNNLAADEPDEPVDLARSYAEIRQTPPAQRKAPTAHLLVQAAEQGNLSAVLDLLPRLPMPLYGGMTSHDRPYAALSALRITISGVDAETW